MAGRPKRAKIAAELTRLALAAEIESDTPCLDYVALALESGETFFDVCGRLSIATGERVYAGNVERLLIDEAGGYAAVRSRLTEARKRGAFLLAEEGMATVDDAVETPAGVAKSRAQLDARMRLAEVYNRESFGTKAAPGLSLSIGELHFAALVHANTEAKRLRASVDSHLLAPGTEEVTADE